MLEPEPSDEQVWRTSPTCMPPPSWVLSPGSDVPTPTWDRHSLLAAHLALEQRITAALSELHGQHEEAGRGSVALKDAWATLGLGPSEGGDCGLWGMDSGEVDAGLSRPNVGAAEPALTLQETQALSSILPLLRLSSALLRQQASEPRPHSSVAGSTLPPSPPTSPPSTAGVGCGAAGDAAEDAAGDAGGAAPVTEPLRKSTSTPTSSREGKSTGDDAAGARTAEASTQTAMSLKIPLLVIASCIFVGNSVSYCTYHLSMSLLTPWPLEPIVSRCGATRIGAVGCAVTFWLCGATICKLSVGLYLVGLRVSGLLDHRSARLLAATNPVCKYRLCLTGRRYRVMGEENAQNCAQNYAEDKTACGDRLARCWWVHCALGSLIGAYFSVVPMVSQPSYDSFAGLATLLGLLSFVGLKEGWIAALIHERRHMRRQS